MYIYTHTLVPEFFLVHPYTETKMPFEWFKGVIFITLLLVLNWLGNKKEKTSGARVSNIYLQKILMTAQYFKINSTLSSWIVRVEIA